MKPEQIRFVKVNRISPKETTDEQYDAYVNLLNAVIRAIDTKTVADLDKKYRAWKKAYSI